jgi:hypothetical protein
MCDSVLHYSFNTQIIPTTSLNHERTTSPASLLNILCIYPMADMAHILLQELWSGQLLLLQGAPWWRVCLCPLSSPPSLQVKHVSKKFQILVTLSHQSFSQPPLLVQRCNDTTARLGYWKVGLEWPLTALSSWRMWTV